MSLDTTLTLDPNFDDSPSGEPDFSKKNSRGGLPFLTTSPRGFQAVELIPESSSSSSEDSSPRDAYMAMADVPSPTLETRSTSEKALSGVPSERTSGSGPTLVERVASGKIPPALEKASSLKKVAPSLEKSSSLGRVAPSLEKSSSLGRVPLCVEPSDSVVNPDLFDSRLRSISAPVDVDPFARISAKPKSVEESPPEQRYRSLSTPRVGFLTRSRAEETELVPITEFTKAHPKGIRKQRGVARAATATSEFRVTLRQLRSLKQLDNKRIMSHALVNYVQSEESYRGNSLGLWLVRILAIQVLAVATILVLLLPTLNDPSLGTYENLNFALFMCPYVTFFACISLTSHILTVLKLETPVWQCALCALSSAVTIGASSMILAQFDIFPVPYWPVTAGTVAVAVCLIVAAAFQPKGTLTDPTMKPKLKWALAIILFNAGGSFLYAFYVALFSLAEGNWQTVVAPFLAIMKVVVKYSNAAIARRLENPDFKHGTALFPDICGTCVSAIIFVNVNSIQTFLLLLTIDTAINLKHCLGILSEITQSQKLKHQRIVRGLCVSRRDAQACSAAIKELQAVTLTPELVELCGDLFFGELTESFVPVIMGMSAWAAFYLPNCNRQYITFMWQNSEAEFTNGMSYVLLDCSIQLALFFILTRYMRFKTGVDITHVGLVIMSRHKLLFSLMTLGITTFFFLLFVDHAGVDTTLRFAWLRAGYNASAIERKNPCF